MLVIDDTLKGGWDLLRSLLEAHLLNKLVKSGLRHIALLKLILVGVLKSILDAVS